MSHAFLVDPNGYELLGVLDESYASVTLSFRLWGVDTFQMRVHRKRLYADSIESGKLIWFPHEDNALFMIESIMSEQTGSVQNDWMTVSGRSLDGFATEERRVIPPAGESHDEVNSVPAETAMKHYVNDHCAAGAPAERQIPGLVVAADLGRGDDVTAEYRYHTVTTPLKEIGAVSGLGWLSRMVYNSADPASSTVEFEVLEGTDHSADVFFDFEYETLEDWHELERIIDSKTFAIVAGQGEDENRDIVERYSGMSEPEGYDRREAFIDARDVEFGNTNLLEMRGDAFLEASSPERSLEAHVHEYGSFRYREHWDRGDIVLVRNRPRGLQYPARVVEVHKTIGDGPERVTAVLDRPFPTIKDKVSASSSAGAGALPDHYAGAGPGTSFTPALIPNVMGDFVATPSSAVGRYWVDGHMVHFYIDWAGTVTYTTAAGGIKLSGLPFTVDNDGKFVPVEGFISGWTKAGYTANHPRCSPGSTTVTFSVTGSGVALAALNITDFPSGSTVTARVSGWFYK